MPKTTQEILNLLPELDQSFFSVCSSAIKSSAWAYKDIPNVQRVEGLLLALFEFYKILPELKDEIQSDSPAPDGLISKNLGVPANETVEVEQSTISAPIVRPEPAQSQIQEKKKS